MKRLAVKAELGCDCSRSLIYRLIRFGAAYVDVGAKAYENQFQARRLAALTANANDTGFKLVSISTSPG